MPVSLRALSESHIPAILEACSDWEELAQHGPPYWRPRSPAEIQRKIDATSGPTPATEYNFVLRTDEGRLVGECSLHAIDWRSRVAKWVSACGRRRIAHTATDGAGCSPWSSGASTILGCIGSRPGSSTATARPSVCSLNSDSRMRRLSVADIYTRASTAMLLCMPHCR